VVDLEISTSVEKYVEIPLVFAPSSISLVTNPPILEGESAKSSQNPLIVAIRPVIPLSPARHDKAKVGVGKAA
jgi:hypothetical protein